MIQKKLPIYLLLIATSSCIQRYDPPKPTIAQADTWKEHQALESPVSCPEPEKLIANQHYSPWWKIFNDQVLDKLQEKALQHNTTILASQARLEAAIAGYGIERSFLFPEIDLGLTASRQRLSRTQGITGTNTSTTGTSTSGPIFSPRSFGSSNTTSMQTLQPAYTICPPQPICPPCPPPVCPCPPPPKPPKTPKPQKPSPYVNQLAILPTLNYELDFWGKNWQAAQAAKDRFKAEQEALHTAFLLVTTTVADLYFQARTFDMELDILYRTEKTRRHNFDLNSKQFQSGLINELPVTQAQSDLESVLASIQEVLELRARAENALATVIGEPAPLFSLVQSKTLGALPEIPAGIPSNILKNRPDIRSEELLMKAAALDVGVAKTEYFPDFSIVMDYGYMSSRANKLFKWKSHTWLLAADAITPLFTAGRISSRIEQTIALYNEQVASYINTVLVSFQEVEDALFSIQADKSRYTHLGRQVKASTRAYEIALNRYNSGLENYLTVVDSERTMLDAKRLETESLRSRYSSTISLIKALGGTWQ